MDDRQALSPEALDSRVEPLDQQPGLNVAS
jgi:hypothetical protein